MKCYFCSSPIPVHEIYGISYHCSACNKDYTLPTQVNVQSMAQSDFLSAGWYKINEGYWVKIDG